MLAHVPKNALNVGVVDQRLLHHLDALTVGVRVTCTGGSDRLAYACSAGGVYVVWLALSLTTWAEPAVGDRAPTAVAPPYEAVRLRLAEQRRFAFFLKSLQLLAILEVVAFWTALQPCSAQETDVAPCESLAQPVIEL